MYRTYSTYSDTALTQHDFIHIRTPSICNHRAFSTIWIKQVLGASTNAGSISLVTPVRAAVVSLFSSST